MQGYCDVLHTRMSWRKAGLSAHQFGRNIGNAQSGNVLLLLYARVLFLAGLITLEEYKDIQSHLHAKTGSLGGARRPQEMLAAESKRGCLACLLCRVLRLASAYDYMDEDDVPNCTGEL